MARKHEYAEAGNRNGLTVKVNSHNFEKAVRQFKKKVMADGVLREYRERQEYERPGAKRRREKNEARRRHLKEVQKRFETEGY